MTVRRLRGCLNITGTPFHLDAPPSLTPSLERTHDMTAFFARPFCLPCAYPGLPNGRPRRRERYSGRKTPGGEKPGSSPTPSSHSQKDTT
ncbi:hypothetical protein VTH06DRAFT_2564 [Thermothelomyces fergusii]